MFSALLQKVMDFLDNADTERRLAMTIVAIVFPLVNSKLSVPLPESVVIAEMVSAMGYVFQSAHKAIQMAKISAATTAQSITVEQARSIVAAAAGVPVVAPVTP